MEKEEEVASPDKSLIEEAFQPISVKIEKKSSLSY